MCYVIRGFKGQKSKTLMTYLKKDNYFEKQYRIKYA